MTQQLDSQCALIVSLLPFHSTTVQCTYQNTPIHNQYAPLPPTSQQQQQQL